MGALGRMKKKVENAKKPGPTQQSEGDSLALSAQMADPEEREKVPAGKMRQMEDAVAMFMKLIHGDDTQESVLKLLGSQPDPMKAVPITTNALFKRVETQAKKKGAKFTDDVKLAAAQYMVTDLADLGNRAGLWDRQVTEEDMGPILQETMQMYIQAGLKDGSIDPIQLQRDVEKLMTPEQKATAMELGGGRVPQGPTPAMAAQQYADKAVSKERQKTQAAQSQAEALKGAVRSQAGAPPQEQPPQ